MRGKIRNVMVYLIHCIIAINSSCSPEMLSLAPKPYSNPKNIKRPKVAFGGWSEDGWSKDGWSEESSKREVLKLEFLNLQYSAPEDIRSVWVPRANTTPSEDYTDTFLSHARLYVFAERFDIQPLKRLTLKNLHQALTSFTVRPDCVNDIVELLIYVYGNTKPDCNGKEPMREMLSQYTGFEMDKMLKAAAFRDLLQQNQDFLEDFCAQVLRRI